MAGMRFRIWHLLAAQVFVALWVPLSRWLLALEAKDHPLKPQTAEEFIAFWLASALVAFLPFMFAWIVVANRKRKQALNQSGSPVRDAFPSPTC